MKQSLKYALLIFWWTDFSGGVRMKQSLYIYNNGDLKRKDNTLQFTTYEGDKRDIPIERISDIYILS